MIMLSVPLALSGGQRAWQQPLGPPLDFPVEVTVTAGLGATPVPDESETPDSEPIPTGDNAPETVPASDPAASTVPQACGGPPRMDLLVIGSDTRSGDYATGRADFIRAVRIDWAHDSVRLLAVPRDLYVNISTAPDHPFLDRINTAYAYGNLYDGPGGGPSLLAATLRHNFGLTFDHYLVVNFEAFMAGVDAVGGVDLELPHGVDGTHQGLRAFPAGPQHLDGAALLDYIRIRYIDSDVHRGQRQDEVIRAMRAKVFRPEVIGDLPGLAGALSRLIETDLSPEQIAGLACAAERLPPEGLTTLRIGWNEVTPHTTSEGAQVLLPRMDRVMAVVAAFTAEVQP